MTTNLRIGMIGAGRMAHVHAEHLINSDRGVEIVAVFSRTAEHANAAAAEWNARPYTDYRRLLDENELDAVYICTPTFIHVEIGLECAERGLHMFVEKPLDLRSVTLATPGRCGGIPQPDQCDGIPLALHRGLSSRSGVDG